jgi:hypothetical protein
MNILQECQGVPSKAMPEVGSQTDTNAAAKKRKQAHWQTLITDETFDGFSIADDDEIINTNDCQTETGGLSFKECMEELRKAANPRTSNDEQDEEDASHNLHRSLVNLLNTFRQGLDGQRRRIMIRRTHGGSWQKLPG